MDVELEYPLVSWDIIKYLKWCEEVNYPVCREHRMLYRLPIDIDLRQVDCGIQPCRTSCPFNLRDEERGAMC